MKIAVITSGLLPVPAVKGGAIETLLDSFISQNELSDNNINLTIYSLNNKEAFEIVKKYNYKKVNYVFISTFSNFIIRVINKIFKRNIPINKYYQIDVVNKVNKQKFDYVIVENYPELTLKLKNHRVIPYIHSDVFNNEISNGKVILDSCYKVIAVSDYIKSRIVEIDNNQEDKVSTIYNSIDFLGISKDKYQEFRHSVRKKYSIAESDFVYGYAGRISPEKGALELVKAFRQLDIPNKKLLIIGGIWYNSSKKNAYLKEVEINGSNDVIYTGYINHKDIQEILCAVDVGVVPSVCNEAAGLSVVEFMNTGNIVIATNKGGIPEYLDIKNNYLIDYEDSNDLIDKLANKMEYCYSKRNDDDIEKILLSNYEFSKKFTVVENYERIIDILKSK